MRTNPIRILTSPERWHPSGEGEGVVQGMRWTRHSTCGAVTPYGAASRGWKPTPSSRWARAAAGRVHVRAQVESSGERLDGDLGRCADGVRVCHPDGRVHGTASDSPGRR